MKQWLAPPPPAPFIGGVALLERDPTPASYSSAFRAKNHRDFVVASAGVGVCPGITLAGYPIRRSLPTYLDETAMMISTRHVQQRYIHSIRRE
ncbi:hypothetical protein BDQ94DRAFT_133634 [Aspergillus welwitschiae]|uniref:Uncharacterized protein n=1 Tax=Aspergillus welwitschiae TaxID=1341132 RepID=A0A3F3QKU2_9EURO|nr:hypothetical protein BDQ94DRAFT_133634 [Aspergillus welwitschiae]RDH39757.1 hypothetical protein BDQ94DRAFT_133634 [Aspergillus welwitschiae]